LAFDGRKYRVRLWRDHCFVEHVRSAFPGHVLGGIDPLLLDQGLVEVAVGAFERPHEGPLLRPAVPLLVLLLHLHRVGLVVPDARLGIDDVSHAGAPAVPITAAKKAAVFAALPPLRPGAPTSPPPPPPALPLPPGPAPAAAPPRGK